ncbi:MAG: GNAT family N-acetyltransferase [Candidatus Fermentibacteraceae bacterium]
MAVFFRDINGENLDQCVDLRVRDDQPFVAPNVYSIAQAGVEPGWVIKAIHSDETMVGFAMYTIDEKLSELYLCRFMIDKSHQGKGCGRAALELLKAIAVAAPGVSRMRLSTSPENRNGIRIYEKFGFVDTGEMEDGEEVFVLELS